jgi:glycosyltransferase involved in cell wall biosynthesis
MRVLFVDNPFSRPTDGGGYTFQQLLLGGLKRMRSSHECSYVQPEPHKGVVQALVVKNQIDFVWFMSGYYEPVEVPFAATVWDLGHRQLPFFPELSLSGWTFEQREQHYRHVLPRASIVITGNAAGARAVSGFYQVAPQNIQEIPLPVDAAALQAVAADRSAVEALALTPAQYLLYPAQFWPHKNHVTLVDMLAVLHDSGRRFKLVFSGSDKGNRAHVESYVAHRGLQQHVVFTGFVDAGLLQQLYLNAFALVFASTLGPDNLPPLEAMALRCPVVCAGFDGAREQLGSAALLFDPLDARAAAAQVLRLEDAQLRQQLLADGLRVVQERTPDEYVRKVNGALDRFAAWRRLWGPCNSYQHCA